MQKSFLLEGAGVASKIIRRHKLLEFADTWRLKKTGLLTRLWSLPLLAAFVVAPWVTVLLISAPLNVAVFFLVILGIEWGVGYLILRIILRLDRYPFLLLLAFGAGYVTVGAVLAYGLIFGLPLQILLWFCIFLGLSGVGYAWTRPRLRRLSARNVARAHRYFLLSLVVCTVFFIPPAFRDAVVLEDGSFQWMYVDTQYHMAMSAAVKNAEWRPGMPGMHEAELRYHFAPYAIAAAVSAALAVPLNDAFGRLLRALSQFTLMMTALGLGLVLGRIAGFPVVAALGSPVLLFFYGSLSALVTTVGSSATTFSDAVLLNIGQLGVQGNGGPFAHILLGHSAVHGTIALALALAIAIALLVPKRPWGRTAPMGTAFLAALFPALNPVAAAGGSGLLASINVIRAPNVLRSWAWGLLILGSAAIGYAIMGYMGSPMNKMHLDSEFYSAFPSIALWFTIGLGARAIIFSQAVARLPHRVNILILILFAGFLSFYIVFIDVWWHNDRYGLVFLQACVSLMAGPLLFALLLPSCGITKTLPEAARVLLQGTRRLAIPLAGVAALGSFLVTVFGFKGNIDLTYGLKVSLAVTLALTIGCLIGTALLCSGNAKLRGFTATVVLSIYAIGFSAWLPDWLNYGLNRAQFAVRVPPDVVAALRQLGNTSNPNTIIATNQHALPSIPIRPERSYAYAALTERPVMLEGWQYGEKLHPKFTAIERDNAILFSTENADEFRTIVDRYNIDFIVVKPNSDIALPAPGPDWLRKVNNAGGLTIYEFTK